MIVFQEDKFN